MKQGTRCEAQLRIRATPEALYDVVTDVRRMGEWSPECTAGEWLDGATGPGVGVRFRGTNRRGLVRWSTTPRIVIADRGREFAFVTPDLLGRDTTKWSYRFQPDDAGTVVVESFEMLRDQPLFVRVPERLVLRVRDRKADLENGMRATLEKLREAVEAIP